MPSSTMKVVVGPVTAHTKIEGLSFDFNSGARVQVPVVRVHLRLSPLPGAPVLAPSVGDVDLRHVHMSVVVASLPDIARIGV